MILRGDNDKKDRPASTGGATLDELFRCAGLLTSSGLALIDPPNRQDITGHPPRHLTYAQADRAISALATKLIDLGLPSDTVVALQLPNTVEYVIALLAVLRARMIAALLPLLWRQRDMTTALSAVGAKAIITCSRIGSIEHVGIAMDVAAELFPIRFVCAFGADLPDGVVALDDIFTAEQTSIVPREERPDHAANHLAVVTFDVTLDGLVPVARNHAQLTAGGASIFLEAGAVRKSEILSAIPPCSFAGIAASVMPWLLEGGTLSLHHGFDPAAFAVQSAAQNGGMIVLPGAALAPLSAAGALACANTTVVALWRSPEQLATTPAWRGHASVVDVASFGEIGVVATVRGPDGLPADLPLGPAGSFEPGGRAIETMRARTGTLALRGAMVAADVFPPGAEHSREPCLSVNDAGFVDTGFMCRLDPTLEKITVTGSPGGLAVIGGYRFAVADIEDQVAAVDPAATLIALPAAILAHRLAGSALYIAKVRSQLRQNGANPLIEGAFRPRRQGSANAA